MAFIDFFNVLRSNIPQSPALRPLNVSPLRMMLINPRKFFTPTEDFDYSKLLQQVYREAIKDYAGNILDANLPQARVLISSLEQATPSFLKNSDGSFYMFYINPYNLRVSHQKVTQETLTGGGWDFDNLEDQLSTYTFTGTSGNLLSESYDLTGVRLSKAFFKFTALEQFYLYNNNDPLLIILDTTAYIGKLVTMSWTWEASDFFQIKYDLGLRVHPKYTFDIISGAGITTLFNSTVLRNVVFDPSIQSKLFESSDANIDSYEQHMRLFRIQEIAGKI